MMLSLGLLFGLLALSAAQYHQQQSNHQSGGSAAPVHYVNIGAQLQGDYKFGYNTGNGGSFREETRNPDGSVSGAYGYIDGAGQQKVIRYTAGKEGFKAEGDDIPKAPPAPQPAAPHAPSTYHQQQPSYNHQQQPSYNHQQQPSYNHQQSYNQPPVPTYSNNYIQPQQSHGYPQYAPPQQYGSQSQGSYNPFAYVTNQGPATGQPLNNHLSQLSYNIGSGGNQHSYRG